MTCLRDHHLLHVGRAFIDAQRADLAIEAFDDMAAAHAVATMQLHGPVDHVLRTVGGEQLGHRRLAGDAGSTHVLGPCGAIDEQSGRVDVERHVGDVALHHLQLGHRRAEQFSFARRASRFRRARAGQSRVRPHRPSSGRRRAPTWRCGNRRRACRSGRKPERGPRRRRAAPADAARSPRCARRPSSPAASAGTRKAEMPLAPGASPVRAKTT